MKRGQSGLSLVLGVRKPSGMSSHDVVNVARRILGERRVGHAGTLDPFAEGVLILLVGPAARLDNYLAGHDKSYVASIVFGESTSTDDLTGEVLEMATPPAAIGSEEFANAVLESFLGKSMQLPPAYSAIKVGGKKACDEARKGNVIKLEPRPVTVHSAKLLGIGVADCNRLSEASLLDDVMDSADGSHSFLENPSDNEHESAVELLSTGNCRSFWKVEFKVSKGTYIRSLARDIGIKAGCPAHLALLERTGSGSIGIDDCVSLEMLEKDWHRAIIDPVHALEFRVVFADEQQAVGVSNGKFLDLSRSEILEPAVNSSFCECIPPFVTSKKPLHDGELLSVVCDNRLKAIYRYDESLGLAKPSCVFSTGVERGI